MSSSQNLVAGVIGVQGDVSEHIGAISRLGAHRNISIDTLVIRQPGLIPKCDFLAIPGGESTTISRLIDDIDLSSEIISYAASGKPLLVTCAGLIVASSNANDPRVKTLNLLDVSINRNAFGRQIDSLETDLPVIGLTDPVPAVFIRAPAVETVSNNVEILAEYEGKPVAIRQNNIIGTSFHPELTSDLRIHDLAFFGTTFPNSKTQIK